MKDKLEVGQTIYSLNIGNEARDREQVLTEYLITKIGRKYFWVQHKEYNFREVKFYIDTLSEVSEYCSGHKLYLSKEEYEDDLRRDNALEKIKVTFGIWNGRARDINTESLIKITEIIDENLGK